MRTIPALFAATTLLAGCNTMKSEPPATTATPATAATASVQSPAPIAAGGVTVQMISATLAEDCGGNGAAYRPPAHRRKTHLGAVSSDSLNRSMAEKMCEQTSMQLSVVAGALASPATLTVKKVEFFDRQGKLLGELSASSPMKWSEQSSVYQPWDQSVASGEKMTVSYALSAPDWSKVPERWGQTFVMKATITVGGKDQTVQHDVQTETQTRLPPGAVT